MIRLVECVASKVAGVYAWEVPASVPGVTAESTLFVYANGMRQARGRRWRRDSANPRRVIPVEPNWGDNWEVVIEVAG